MSARLQRTRSNTSMLPLPCVQTVRQNRRRRGGHVTCKCFPPATGPALDIAGWIGNERKIRKSLRRLSQQSVLRLTSCASVSRRRVAAIPQCFFRQIRLSLALVWFNVPWTGDLKQLESNNWTEVNLNVWNIQLFLQSFRNNSTCDGWSLQS